MHARQHVEQRAIVRRGKADAVGGDHRHPKRLCQSGERHEIGFFVAQQMALELDTDTGAAEQADEAIEQSGDTVVLHLERRPAGQGHETGRAALELLERERPLALSPHREACAAGTRARGRASSCA